MEAVGSATPAWNSPKSDWPRWTNSPAVRLRPSPIDSSATIVATPSAMPIAVAIVRKRCRVMFVTTSLSTERATLSIRLAPDVAPRTQYARNGDVSIAYQVVGDGPVDLLLSFGFATHVELIWEEPGMARFLTRLTKIGRLILYDRRGTGLSDPVPGAGVEVHAADVGGGAGRGRKPAGGADRLHERRTAVHRLRPRTPRARLAPRPVRLVRDQRAQRAGHLGLLRAGATGRLRRPDRLAGAPAVCSTRSRPTRPTTRACATGSPAWSARPPARARCARRSALA